MIDLQAIREKFERYSNSKSKIYADNFNNPSFQIKKDLDIENLL
jgi:hypothetical protein